MTHITAMGDPASKQPPEDERSPLKTGSTLYSCLQHLHKTNPIIHLKIIFYLLIMAFNHSQTLDQ